MFFKQLDFRDFSKSCSIDYSKLFGKKIKTFAISLGFGWFCRKMTGINVWCAKITQLLITDRSVLINIIILGTIFLRYFRCYGVVINATAASSELDTLSLTIGIRVSEKWNVSSPPICKYLVQRARFLYKLWYIVTCTTMRTMWGTSNNRLRVVFLDENDVEFFLIILFSKRME